MTFKIYFRHFLFNQIILMSIVSAVSASSYHYTSNIATRLPVSIAQIKNLAQSICYSIEPFFTNQTIAECQEKIANPKHRIFSHRKSIKVWCRTNETLRFEVEPLNYWQLVVLIPDPSDDRVIINYSLLRPNTSFGQISMTQPYRSYVLLTSVLNTDCRPTVWRREKEIPPWDDDNVPSYRRYDIQVQFIGYQDTKYVKAMFNWNQTGDNDICFNFNNFCKESGDKMLKMKPNSSPSFTIDKMRTNDECTVQVTGYYGTTEMNYRTPVRAQYETEPEEPEIPSGVSVEAVQASPGWRVAVRWAAPRRRPDRYNVTLRADRLHSVLRPPSATEAIFMGVFGGGLYDVSVEAVRGPYTAHTSRRAIFPAVVRTEWRWAGGVGASWAVLAIGIFFVGLYWVRLRRRIYAVPKEQEVSECKPLEGGSESGASGAVSGCSSASSSAWSGAASDGSADSAEDAEPAPDAWELRPERLALREALGGGAFGIVHRALLLPQQEQVAVKMLKDFPTIEEIRDFRLEMELMKSVGAHPHVVSLLGCCSGKRPLIVVEYCSRGDLLTFLRHTWDMMISKRNAEHYNNNIEMDYRNDLFKCPPHEQSQFVVNKLYDIQEPQETELTPMDLLSFCRQIAMGMEFLAANRLVHRDLAARNVLVTEDRTLKIADFGLSRDVYEENQYKQKGNGKMPVKWMALESLTRRIYTSQSDVWSFGVVMWEVVTLGGAPYAGVAAARLPRLLRAGYRMPRPANCPPQLYEVMLSCWRAEPRLRPTFATLHSRLDALLQCACADHYLSLELGDYSPPPLPAHQRYFRMILRRSKRAWNRAESYERPLKVPPLLAAPAPTHGRTPA